MYMYWQDSFFFDTTNAADTYETIATSPSNNTVLQNFLVHNKHSGTIVFNAKLVYLHDDAVTTTDIILSEDYSLTTKISYNLVFESALSLSQTWGNSGTFSMPQGSYIQIKSDTLNSMDVVCTLRTYSEDRFQSEYIEGTGFTTTTYSNF